MKKFVLAALGAVTLLGSVAPADAQWRRGRDRVIIERTSPSINGGVLATILAIQLARKARERETIVREPAREFVPLK